MMSNFREEEARREAEEELKSYETQNKEELKEDVETVDIEKEELVNKNEKVSERQFTEIELEQMELGWDPYRTGPDAVSAKEYKRVGEIIQAKQKASKEAQLKAKEVEELTKTVKQLVENQRQAEKVIRERTLREIEARKLQAVEEGDIEAFRRAEQDALLQQSLAAAPVPAELPPASAEVIAFQEENKDWLNSNKPSDVAMQAYVKARVAEYQATNPNIDEKVAIASIKEGLAQEFPNRFINPNKPKAPATMSSTVSSSGKQSSYSVSMLSHDQKREFDLIRDADSSYTLKEHIEVLRLIGKLDK
jgi:hypothetical protein